MRAVLYFVILLFTSTVGAQEYLCDDHPVAEQASSRIPPNVTLGKTCVCRDYPPGIGDVALYIYKKKIKPAVVEAAHWIAEKIHRVRDQKQKLLAAFR